MLLIRTGRALCAPVASAQPAHAPPEATRARTLEGLVFGESKPGPRGGGFPPRAGCPGATWGAGCQPSGWGLLIPDLLGCCGGTCARQLSKTVFFARKRPFLQARGGRDSPPALAAVAPLTSLTLPFDSLPRPNRSC